MFERFTHRSRQVMEMANEEAFQMNHDHVGEGHILLGLIREESGLAGYVLRRLGVKIDEAYLEVEELEFSPGAIMTSEILALSTAAGRGVERAYEEARKLNHDYIGTEHLILGLIRDPAGVAVQVLTRLGEDPAEVREDVLSILGVPNPPDVD